MWWQTLAPVLPDVFALSVQPSAASVGVVGVGDPEATRTVYASVVILALLGVVLVVLAVWVFKRTRPEPELLAPLETMNTRGWRKLDPAAQRRSLDESRPTGAVPMRRAASAPPVDSSFATVAPVASFDDLSDATKRVSDGETDPPVTTSADETTPTDRDAGTGEPAETDSAVDPVDSDQAADPEPSVDESGADEARADEDPHGEQGAKDGDAETVRASSEIPESIGVVTSDDSEVTEDEIEDRVENGEVRHQESDVAEDDDTGEIVDDGLGLDAIEIAQPDVVVPIDPLLAQRRASTDPSS